MTRYSVEQQTQIIKMKSEGITSRSIAKELGLSKSGVNDFYNRLLSLFAEEHKGSFMFTPPTKAEKEYSEVDCVREAIIPLIKNHTDDCRKSFAGLSEYKQVASKDLIGEICRPALTGFRKLVSELKPVSEGYKERKAQEFKEKIEVIDKDYKLDNPMKIVTSPLRSGNKTHMYIPDSQVKPDISFEYLRCVGEYIVEKLPDVIICAGDFADLPSLSSYDEGKGKAEGKRVKKDIEAVIEGMQTLLKPLYDYQQKQLKEFGFIGYKPRMVLTLGNHESRLTRYTNDNPALIDFISIDALKYKEQGWEVYGFLDPVLVDGITYIHYLPNEFTGRPQGGTATKILADFGGSITQGHKQTLVVATRFAPATGQQTWYLQAGACYDHNEDYKGLYNNNHFRGLFMKYNLDGKGNYDLHTVSLQYIMDKYSWT